MQVNKWLPTHSEIIENAVLSIIFKNVWFQDDVEEIRRYIFLTIANTTKIEDIFGADLESTCFSWRHKYFSLNFEFYSQSCWIEAEGKTDTKTLKALETMLYQQKQ